MTETITTIRVGEKFYTAIDKNNNGILRPEEGDDVLKGENPHPKFPSLWRVPPQYWRNTQMADIENTLKRAPLKK